MADKVTCTVDDVIAFPSRGDAMADFPLSGHSEAISKILSSVVPPKAYAYFTPFLPGLFVEVSIFLANPELIQKLIARSNQTAVLGKYSLVFVAAFLAFVIGHALILWVGFVHRILSIAFRVLWFVWKRFCIWPLLPVLNRLIEPKPQSWLGRRSSIKRLRQPLSRIYQSAHNIVFNLGLRSVGERRLWAILARHVFEERFGIKLQLEQEEWDALYEASPTAQLTELGNRLLMLATQALGWGGLVAIRFAPTLANRTYIVFSAFMVAIGIVYEWWLIRSMNDSYVLGLLKLRALLRDLRRLKAGKSAEANKEKSAI